MQLLTTILGGAVGAAIVTGIFAVIKFKMERKAAREDKEENKTDVVSQHISEFERQKSSCSASFDEQKEINQRVSKELTVVCYGVCATLKGLIELGCDGPCKDALSHLEKHLNETAHYNIK